MAETGFPAALSDLIGAIYDCALDPSLWDRTLARMRTQLDCETAILSLWQPADGRLLIHRSVGIPEDALAQMASHAPEISRMVESYGSALPADAPHVLSRHVPVAYQQTSPYIRDFLRPAGIVDIMQYFLMQTAARNSAIAFGRSERQGVVTDREIDIGRMLLPHVRRAVTISNILDAGRIERVRFVEALDALRCAVVLTDEQARILHANRSAEVMLGQGELVASVRGALDARLSKAGSELRKAIALSAEDKASIGKTGLAIRLNDGELPPLFAHVLPLTAIELHTASRPSAVAAVFIGVPPDQQDSATTVAAEFGLTPAETRVLTSLMAGQTLAETADALNVAIATAKTHLDRIFSKTGVSRQADLMRLGIGVTSPLRRQTGCEC